MRCVYDVSTELLPIGTIIYFQKEVNTHTRSLAHYDYYWCAAAAADFLLCARIVYIQVKHLCYKSQYTQ